MIELTQKEIKTISGGYLASWLATPILLYFATFSLKYLKGDFYKTAIIERDYLGNIVSTKYKPGFITQVNRLWAIAYLSSLTIIAGANIIKNSRNSTEQ